MYTNWVIKVNLKLIIKRIILYILNYIINNKFQETLF